MYNDFRSPSRETWKYDYQGSDLVPFAKARYAEYLAKEKEAREKLAGFMRDMKMGPSDAQVEQVKHDVANFGNLREQCAVFVHEFSRTPGRVFALSLSDVVFFGIVPDPQ